MSLKKYKPSSPGLRQVVLLNKKYLDNIKPIKFLTKGKKQNAGKNNQGRITSRHRGGGHKRRYRQIDFLRKNNFVKVNSIEYDPNRSAFISSVVNSEKQYSYIIAPDGIKKGQILESGPDSSINLGNTLPLEFIPLGSLIHNIELYPNQGAKYARAAGSYGQLLQKNVNGSALVKLKSGQQILINSKCNATIGVVSNLFNKNKNLGKAGRSRWLSKRPSVRGLAMNPVDHPNGGGSGKMGHTSKTPKGFPTQGRKTRRNKKKLLFKIYNN